MGWLLLLVLLLLMASWLWADVKQIE